jgi:hypothetical protein
MRKDRWVTHWIADDNPHAMLEFRWRALGELQQAAPDTAPSEPEPRTVAELMNRGHALAQARIQAEAAAREERRAKAERAAAAARKKHLESLRGNEQSLWDQLKELIDSRKPKSYDEAIKLLLDLRDLAAMQGKASAFSRQMMRLRDEHKKKRTLVQRFYDAELLK